MIRANDLMIGDWVNTPDSISRVIYIAKYSGIYTDNTNIGEKLYSPYEINPIPLTPEILEKNGFEIYGNEWQYHTEDDKGHVLIEFSKDNKLSINIYNSLALKDDKGRADLVHFGRDWCDSFYVNEFQHCLKMVGIEKEITI